MIPDGQTSERNSRASPGRGGRDGGGNTQAVRGRDGGTQAAYRDDPWPWIMVVITFVIGSIIVAAIRLPEILHAFGAAMTIDHLTVLS